MSDIGRPESTIRAALVTGASSGIGRAIAAMLAARHLDVWIVGRDTARLAATATEVRAAGGEPHVVRADIAHDAGIETVLRTVHRETDRLDVVVHAAGVAYATSATAEADEGAFDAHFAVNTRAPMRITAGVLRTVQRAHGLVVVVNSVAALRTAPGFATYASSKSAVKAWADALREEVAGRGVRVCSVYPGQVATDMQAAIYAARGEAYHPERLLQVGDVAELVAFAFDHPTVDITDLRVRSASGGYAAHTVID